ncbi:MAG: globin domain-containing protein [Campylobacterota bacterium]|nr:globin domain-containing protein [Campylobacterota bacterium]
MSLSEKTIETVKSSAALVAENSESITSRMYEILFENYPDTKELFKDADPDQYKKLAAAISAYAANIDNLNLLSQSLETIAKSHVKAKVKPEHYPLVAVAFLGAMQDVLADAATKEVLLAWKDAYLYLAHILIVREKKLYHQQ